MTYLDLINAVLTRLREEEITQSQWDADNDPYWRFIGSAINDAKARVEDAWQWSALRGSDAIPLSVIPPQQPGDFTTNYELPNSDDNHYIIKGFFWQDSNTPGGPFRPVLTIPKPDMIRRYSIGTDNVPEGNPAQITVNRRSTLTGNLTVVVYPKVPLVTTNVLFADRVVHQPDLVAATDVLLVPSLPVYTLATALASRERGEVGGTPTSELFPIADRHLADAIAQDSALFPTELDWYANTDEHNTNVRFA
jgi:hypothetical protein